MNKCQNMTNLAGITEKGRREKNEDSILFHTLKDSAILLAVADGLGGHLCGEYASSIAIQVLKEGFDSSYCAQLTTRDIDNLFQDLFLKAHQTIVMEGIDECHNMGTTLVSAIIRGDEAIIANTGDSRAYVFGKNLKCITKDHTVVQSLIDDGVIKTEDARDHPMKNMLMSSLGGFTFRTDLFHISLTDEVSSFFLCSDGLSNFIGEEDMKRSLILPSAEDSAKYMVNLALHYSDDNVSVVIYRK